MAQQMQAAQQVKQPSPAKSGVLQRTCACGQHAEGGECTECKRKRESTLQRATFGSVPDSTGSPVPASVHEVLNTPGQPLDDATRSYMEPRFGRDFSRVRVHLDGPARAVNAVAFTVGDHIVFGPGQYQPQTPRGRHLLAHELTHVTQQEHARPGVQPRLAIGAVDDPAEVEAEQAAGAVLSEDAPVVETRTDHRPLLRRFSESEHRRIGDGAYKRAFSETQAGGGGSKVPAVDPSFVGRLKEFSFDPGSGASLNYGQMVAVADEIASFELLEQQANERKGTRIPLLSSVWDVLGDEAHYLDLAARNTAHFHPHNYLSWQPWHWQALRTMDQAWQTGERANRLKTEVRNLLKQFDVVERRARAAARAGDRAGKGKRQAASDVTMQKALAQMEALLGQAQRKQAEYQSARTQANDMAVRAMAMNGFGDHFLTDAFAAGHIVTPRQELLTEYTTQLLGFIPVGGVLNCANIPSLAWHDLDNAFGVEVNNFNGKTWTTYGDDFADKEAAPGGKTYSPTLEHAVEATAGSIRQMWQAARGQQPSSVRPVLNQLPRPNLDRYPRWTAQDWNRQLRYAAGEQLGMNPDPMSAEPRKDVPQEKPPNPKGHQIGSGLVSARATCLDLIDRFTYGGFVEPMIARIRKDYDKRYFTGRSDQVLSPSVAPTPQASVTGRVVLGSIIGAGIGAIAGAIVGGLAGGLLGAVIGGVVGLVGGFLLGGLIGGLFGKRRDLPAPGVVQPKLAVNTPGDEYEQEADQVAEKVTGSATGSMGPVASPIKRSRLLASTRQESPPASVDQVLAGSGSPLNPTLQNDMEQQFDRDFSNVRVHTDTAAQRSAQEMNARAYTVGNTIAFGPGQFAPDTLEGRILLAHELTHVVQQSGSTLPTAGRAQASPAITRAPGALVQRQTVPEAATAKSVTFRIAVTRPMTRAEFLELAELTIYGRRMAGFTWEGGKDLYTVADSPVTATVPVETLQNRLKAYGEHVGKVIEGLDQVQDATTYQRLNRIIQKLNPAQWADYEKRVTTRANSIDAFEVSVDAYLARQARREAEAAHRDQLVKRLYGSVPLYELYLAWKSQKSTAMMVPSRDEFGVEDPNAPRIRDFRDEAYQKLVAELPRYKFGTVAEFEQAIADYELAFRTETIKIGLDLMEQYDSALFKEGVRYQDPAEVAALHAQLAPLRAEMPKVEKNAAVWNQYVKDAEKEKEIGRLPGNAGIGDLPKERQQQAAVAKADAERHRETARQSVVAISETYPVLKEDQLPLDRRLDKSAMAKADPTQLMALLKSHIEARRGDIKTTRETLAADPDKVFGLNNLVAISRNQQGIEPTSIFARIIDARASSIKIKELIFGIMIGVIAVALTIVSFGTGAIAVAAALGAFSLSAGMAYHEYIEFERKSAAYGAGMSSEDPDPVWLVVAVVGAAVDLGAAVRAVKVIAPLAKTLEAGGDAAKFTNALKAMEDAGKIDSKIARSAEQAGIARSRALEAARGLERTLGSKAYSFPGALADPDVYKDVVKLVYYRSREAGFNFIKFVNDVKQARASAKLAELSADEVNLLRRAYDEGRAFASEADLVKYMKTRPLGGKSIVVDENMLIARHLEATGGTLDDGHKKVLAYLKANPDAKLTVTEELYSKVAGKMNTSDLSIIESTAKAGSPEYDAVAKVLEDAKVGATKGAEDRRMIADALFAKAEAGAKPTFATHDAGIYKKMFMLDKTDPKALMKLGKPLPQLFPDGFDVVINGRTIRVIPIATK